MNKDEPRVVHFHATRDALCRIGQAVVAQVTGEEPDLAAMPVTGDGLIIGKWHGARIGLALWRRRVDPCAGLYMAAHGNFGVHAFKLWYPAIPDALALVRLGGEGVEVMNIITPCIVRITNAKARNEIGDWNRELEAARDRVGWRRGTTPS